MFLASKFSSTFFFSFQVIIACPMKFAAFPLDHQICKFLVRTNIKMKIKPECVTLGEFSKVVEISVKYIVCDSFSFSEKCFQNIKVFQISHCMYTKRNGNYTEFNIYFFLRILTRGVLFQKIVWKCFISDWKLHPWWYSDLVHWSLWSWHWEPESSAVWTDCQGPGLQWYFHHSSK